MGRTAFAAGTVLGVLTVAWTAASIGVSRVLDRLSYRPVALVGSAALIAGAGATLLLQPAGGVVPVALACLLTGVGLGLHSLVFNVVVQTAVPQADRGRATSLFFFCRLLGQAVGAALFGGVLNAGLTRAGLASGNAVRDLIDPASRLALQGAELARLAGALAGALGAVHAVAAWVSLLTLLPVRLVPRRARLKVRDDG